MPLRIWPIVLTVALLVPARTPARAQGADGLTALVLQLEDALRSGSIGRFRALIAPGMAAADVTRFEVLVRGARIGAAVRERDRNALDSPAGTVELLLDTFVERGASGQIATWRATASAAAGAAWHFTSFTQLSSVDGLYKLALGEQAFDVRGLTLEATDFTLHMKSGTAFTADADGGITGIVLRGKGELVFTPPDDAERAQVSLFSGQNALRVPFEEAFVRLNPGEFESRAGTGALVARAGAVTSDERRKAVAVFDSFVTKTYTLDLQDLSRERWSLVPAGGDFVAEVRTNRYGTLTYALAGGEAEDVSLFQRDTRRNISVYASASQLAQRGRFYSEDERSDYDIHDLDLDVRLTPARDWIDGTAVIRARVRSHAMSTMTLRLAEPLVVRSVVSKTHGRLMHLRVIGQHNLLVTLPSPAAGGDELELEVRYAGRLPPQLLDREAVDVEADQDLEPPVVAPEPRWIYSNRSYWYPQSTINDYATSRVRITVPQPFDVVATGVQTSGPAAAVPGGAAARTWVFESGTPARYLTCVVSKFVPVISRAMAPDDAGVPSTLNVIASPRQTARARSTGEQAEAIFGFYRGLLGSAPYPQLTVAISESELPGGHSPAYFVLLNQTMPGSALTYRTDPVSFDNFPAFFLAHEVAHQWWGQAVGWKNYHEQWISEGFAQYFAALYAGEERGPAAFAQLMRQMRRWALEKSGEGPIYLGYRLGHIRSDSRVFRAVVYNKSAIVLHMLRRLLGDDKFFAGVRRFYEEFRFAKAGTNDFRRVMEAAGGQNLERFFERWVYGFGVPSVKVTHRVEQQPGGPATLIVTGQQTGPVYDLPIALSVEMDNGVVTRAVLVMSEATSELRLPLSGRLRRVHVDSDGAALARFTR
ncbi:MAG: hypothetical protein M3R55_01995 [Acidobacteriota bacterium]|nr:hypothetical protein [Acidobacteriota bacterium]